MNRSGKMVQIHEQGREEMWCGHCTCCVGGATWTGRIAGRRTPQTKHNTSWIHGPRPSYVTSRASPERVSRCPSHSGCEVLPVGPHQPPAMTSYYYYCILFYIFHFYKFGTQISIKYSYIKIYIFSIFMKKLKEKYKNEYRILQLIY